MTRKPKATPKATPAKAGPEAVIRVLAESNPYREGTAGRAVFAIYRDDGMTVAKFSAAAAGLTGTRKPVDMLRFDVHKGHVRVEAAAAKKSKR